ncbi:MAG: EndoU domain-containing protein [Streptosporangiaceae bacterium]
MADDIARVDVADAPAGPPPDWSPAGPGDVQGRLARLADSHPSSPRYNTADSVRPRGGDGLTGSSAKAEADERQRSGWHVPDVRRHPDRPDPDEVHLPADRARHALAGDGPGAPGGGHRHGAERPGKTEFPASWSDDMIVATVQDVARHPDAAHWQGFNSRWRVSGERDGVSVTAVVLSDGRIWAAWPDPGGAGVTRNPRA